MKRQLLLLTVLGIVSLLAIGTSNAANRLVPSQYPTIQAAINAAETVNGDVIEVADGTYHEAVTINKEITLQGQGPSTIITNASGNGITVTANHVTIQDLKVTGCSSNGISASGVSNLTINTVNADGNTASGAVLSSCSSVTVIGGSYSHNLIQGINAYGGGSTYSLSDVTANNNGSTSPSIIGSGINLKGMAGATATNCTANENVWHGISVGDGASNLVIDGGTFNGNGVAGDAETGGGINIVAQNNTTTTNITVKGMVTCQQNTTAGIYVFGDNNHGTNAIGTVNIGPAGSTIAVTGNGSVNTGVYDGGAGIVVYGKVTDCHISNTTFTQAGGAAPGSGLMNLGDGTRAGSPSNTTVTASNFIGYTDYRPAVTLTDGQGDFAPQATNDVVATTNSFTFAVIVKVFLQGPYSGGSMRTDLRLGAPMPLGQPYNTPAFGNYNGGESVAAIPADVVDWILIELREAFDGPAVSRRAVFLKNDGTVYDPLGGPPRGGFIETKASGYTISNFIVIRHRNHLAVMSANPVSLPNVSALYDFTTDLSKYYGGQAALLGSIFGMLAGDTNSDGLIDVSDFISPDNDSGSAGYLDSDENMDGIVDVSDFIDPDNNSGTISNVP